VVPYDNDMFYFGRSKIIEPSVLTLTPDNFFIVQKITHPNYGKIMVFHQFG
jgi:hypothetical protein